MKPLPAVLIMFALSSVVCSAGLEFTGFSKIGKETKFVLTDSEEGRPSDWLAIGESFAGYSLVSFDAKNEVLTVKKGDQLATLPLKQGKVLEGQSNGTPLLKYRLSTDGTIENVGTFKRLLSGVVGTNAQVDVELQLPSETKVRRYFELSKVVNEAAKELNVHVSNVRITVAD